MNYSKARNLEHLRKKNINVPKFIYFKVSSYIKNKKFFIEKIKKNFSGLLAIRSSASNEDTKRSSLAGYYDSFLNIPISDENLIKKHIDLVIKSYKKKRGANHEILVQKMVSKIKFSGVLLSRDINNYNPCYVINYSTGSDTSTVTSGKNKTQCIKYFINKKYKLNYPFNKIVSIAEKIKKLYRSDVDIEFIVDKKNRIHIVQARNLYFKKRFQNNNIYNTKYFLNNFLNLEKKILKLKKQHHNLLGNDNFFGVMPDWNPAEIIGKKPKPLALSLYRELITDHVWSENRSIV